MYTTLLHMSAAIRRCLMLAAILLGLTPILAEAGTLSGRVMDRETGNVLSDVNIAILETGQVKASDKYGQFVFENMPEGRYTVIASHIAYDRSDSISVTVDGVSAYDIALTPKPWVLNDVVVTGTRSPHLLKDVPVQTEVVTTRDFQRTGATSVDEALRSSIGIDIDEGLAGQGATLRGIEGDRVLVLVDGERAVGRVRGTIDLSQYALTNVKKIEVVKGTGSTLYGSDAMGGVINIITRDPARATRRFDINFDGGSHWSFNPSAEYEYGGERFGYTLGAKLYGTDGFDLREETPHTNGQEKVRRWNVNGKSRYALSKKWKLVGSGRFMYEDRDWIESELLPGFDDAWIINDDEEINRRYEGSLALDYLSGDKYSMKFRVYGSYYDHDWTKSFEDRILVDESATEDMFYQLSYNANYAIGHRHVVTFGADYTYQDLTSTELVTEKEADRSADAYLQYEYSPHTAWTFLPGVRLEHHDSFGGHVNPSMNVMYQATKGIKFRGFVGYGFRAPSIKQQYFIFDHTAAGYIVYGGSVDLPDNIANTPGLVVDDLTEETSINSSVSVELSYGTIGLHRLTYFYNHLDDLIDFGLVTIDPGTYWRGIYIYQNIETALTQGIEWESRIRLSSAVDVSFSYNYLDARNLSTGEELLNRPTHTAKFFTSAYLEKWRAGATVWGNYHSKKLWVSKSNTGEQESEAEYAPSRTTINLNLFKKIGNDIEGFVRFENIFDDVNVDFGYWPGFQVFLGFKYGFTTNR